jgi:hypothetical protein
MPSEAPKDAPKPYLIITSFLLEAKVSTIVWAVGIGPSYLVRMPRASGRRFLNATLFRGHDI